MTNSDKKILILRSFLINILGTKDDLKSCLKKVNPSTYRYSEIFKSQIDSINGKAKVWTGVPVIQHILIKKLKKIYEYFEDHVIIETKYTWTSKTKRMLYIDISFKDNANLDLIIFYLRLYGKLNTDINSLIKDL